MLLGGNISKEAHLAWQFIKRDVALIFAPVIFMGAAVNIEETSLNDLLSLLISGFLLFGLHLFSFCVSNQITGIEEDKVNKPDRPLAIGIISPRQALIRWVISMVLFSLVGWWCGVLEWVMLLQLGLILYNFGGWGKHWLGRTTILTIGFFALLMAAWTMIAPLNSTVWKWILVLSFSFGLLINIADFRDLAGDRLIGRLTLPIILGETTTRFSLSIGFGLLIIVIHFVLLMPAGLTVNVMIFDLVQATIGLIIILRLMLYRSPQNDDFSYRLTNYLYCVLLVSGITIL